MKGGWFKHCAHFIEDKLRPGEDGVLTLKIYMLCTTGIWGQTSGQPGRGQRVTVLLTPSGPHWPCFTPHSPYHLGECVARLKTGSMGMQTLGQKVR